MKFWKNKPTIGVGVGVSMGVLGAIALAARYALRSSPRRPIPDNISPAVFSTNIAQTAHGEMVYHASGSGSPIVFLHGIYPGASSYEWSKVYPSFTDEYTVIAPDLLGFGESERPKPGLDADQHVQALADGFREIMPGNPATVVASGFGAALAAKLAAQHPELVRSLVLLAPEGFDSKRQRVPRGIRFLAGIPRMNSFFYRHAISRQPFVRDWLLRFGFRNSALIDPDVVDVIATCASQYGAEYAMLSFLKGRARYDVNRQLPRITQPTTLLWPEADRDFPIADADAIVAAVPFCRVLANADISPLGALECHEITEALVRSALGPISLEQGGIAA